MVFEGSYEDSKCAVKILVHFAAELRSGLPVSGGMDESIKAFDKECKLLEELEHPNIVQHLSSDTHPASGNKILVMELMDCSLSTYLSDLGEEPLSSDHQIILTKDVASGLAYIHSKGIIHRDLCGDNILLKLGQQVPTVKISDFGMSRLVDPLKLTHTLTAMGHRMGYLPPEAPQEGKYDYSLDVFSLGVIMVQIAHKLKTVKSEKGSISLCCTDPKQTFI